MKRRQSIDDINEDTQNEIGQQWADLLMLKRAKGEKKIRYKTAWGLKSPAGIFRMVSVLSESIRILWEKECVKNEDK